MEFKRFEEETQIQTYQKPIGFSPQTSVSQSGAIGQQYKQNVQSSAFYEQSLKERDAIREANDKINDINFQNQDLFKTIDTLQDFLPKINQFAQAKIKEGIKAKEQEGYVNEMQRVYDNGFTDEEKAEMSMEQQTEKLQQAGFSQAQLDAFQQTGNPELAHVIGMKNKYAQAGAARAFAQRQAAKDPTTLQQRLLDERAKNGKPLSESQIRQIQADHNGQGWVASGLTAFKPTFLGEKFFTTLRGNQEKVISKTVLNNRIEQSQLDRDVYLNDYWATISSGGDAGAAFQTLINQSSATIDGNGRQFSRTRTLAAWSEMVGARAQSMAEINKAFDFTDPVTNGPARIARAKYYNKAVAAFQQRQQQQRRLEEQTRQDRANEVQADAIRRGQEAGFAINTPEMSNFLANDATLNQARSDLFGANFGDVDRVQSAGINPAAQRAAEALINNMEVVTDADLANPNLSADFVQRFKANNPRYQGYAERKELAAAEKEATNTFKRTVKRIAPNYITESSDGTLTADSGEGQRMVRILEAELQFQLADVRRNPEYSQRSLTEQVQIATNQALEAAKKKYGLGLTKGQAEKAGIPNPIMATDPNKKLSLDALTPRTLPEKILDLDENNPQSYIDVPYGEDAEQYKKNLLLRSADWFDGTLRELSPLEKAAMQKFQLPYTDLLNKARLAAGLPAIPYSQWETALKNLQKTDPEKYKQMFDPVAGVSAQQRAMGQMEPTPPVQQAPAPASQQQPPGVGGPSLPGVTERDEQGNWLNTNAVYKAYSETPIQAANTRRFMPSFYAASKTTGTPAALGAALAGKESSMLPRKGPQTPYGRAVGPMQIMPGKWHPNMPATEEGQIEYGMQYLAQMRNFVPDGGVHPSVPYPKGSWRYALFLYSGDHNRKFDPVRDGTDYVDKIINQAYSFGMSKLLSSGDMVRPTFSFA